MARPLRLEIEGGLFHLTSRGDGREPIFLADGDRETFLDILGNVVKRYHWLCYAFCLMGNHYHLLVETPEGNLSPGMRQLNGVYTQRFNVRHRRVGHVFQGRFKAIMVNRDGYLMELCRYLVLNPVRAKLVEYPEDWAWSSYRSTNGLTEAPRWLSVDWILAQFGGSRVDAKTRYRAFVREGILAPSPWEGLKGQVFLGDELFLQKMGRLLDDKEELREIPRTQRLAARPRLRELVGNKDQDKEALAGRVHQAFARHGYTQKEIADHLGVHPATVSRMIRRNEE